MSLCEDRISNIQNQVPHQEWRSDSLELLRLTQTRLPEQHFFPASKIRQRSLLCWRSCTDSLPTPRVRKKSTSGASQWINFHNSKTFVNYFRYRTSFLMLENPIQHSPGAQRILTAVQWTWAPPVFSGFGAPKNVLSLSIHVLSDCPWSQDSNEWWNLTVG